MESKKSKKEAQREELKNRLSYQILVKTAKYMDQYFLDPILGFVLPAGVGDMISSIFAFPFIYYSLCIVRSIPLTLAVIYNILFDILIGSIPFFIGDVLDVFKHSYIGNLKLITGFVEGDKLVIHEVNKKAAWTCVAIVALCLLIYAVVALTIKLIQWLI